LEYGDVGQLLLGSHRRARDTCSTHSSKYKVKPLLRDDADAWNFAAVLKRNKKDT